METTSFWTIYTTTDKKSNAEKIIKTLLSENPTLTVKGEIAFEYYEKTEVIRANLKCVHVAENWEMIAFDVIRSVKSLSCTLQLIGCLDETVDLIATDIKGAMGGISQIFVEADR
jgi:hypothetical protein